MGHPTAKLSNPCGGEGDLHVAEHVRSVRGTRFPGTEVALGDYVHHHRSTCIREYVVTGMAPDDPYQNDWFPHFPVTRGKWGGIDILFSSCQ